MLTDERIGELAREFLDCYEMVLAGEDEKCDEAHILFARAIEKEVQYATAFSLTPIIDCACCRGRDEDCTPERDDCIETLVSYAKAVG